MNTTPFLYFFTFVQTNPANTSILFSMPLFYFMRSVLKRTQEGCIHVCHATYKPEITPNLFFPANILKHSRTNKINIFSPPYLFKIHILYVFFFFYFCWFLWYINCSNSVHYIILKPQRVGFHRASGISTGAKRLCTKLSNICRKNKCIVYIGILYCVFVFCLVVFCLVVLNFLQLQKEMTSNWETDNLHVDRIL